VRTAALPLVPALAVGAPQLLHLLRQRELLGVRQRAAQRLLDGRAGVAQTVAQLVVLAAPAPEVVRQVAGAPQQVVRQQQHAAEVLRASVAVE
jgi:hypothetical protein